MRRATTACPIVARALFIEPVVDIGQLSASELSALRLAVLRGYLVRAKAGPFFVPKPVYARPGFDFAKDRFEALAEYRVCMAIDAIRRAPLEPIHPDEDDPT